MIFKCTACGITFRLIGDRKEKDYLLAGKESFPCPAPLCGGRLVKGDALDAARAQEVPVARFFRAVHGFGFADGAPAEVARVKRILLEKKIVQVVASDINESGKTIIEHLIMEDGTRLHFAASSYGACVYYVEGPSPTCVEVFDAGHHAGNQGSCSCGSSHREEAGRDLQAGEGQLAEPAADRGVGLQEPGLSDVQEASGVPPDTNDDGL